MIDANEFASRRARLMDRLEDDSAVLLFSGVAKSMSADASYPFEVNRNFYYLTGIDQEDSALFLVKSEGACREFLFISPFDPVKEKWYGRRLTPEEAARKSGIRNVLLNSALSTRIDSFCNPSGICGGQVKSLYFDFEKEQKIAADTYAVDYQHTMAKLYPDLPQRDCYGLITSLRAVKSKAEIAEFRQAVEHTRLGIQAIMAGTRDGVYEYELAHSFFHVINDDSHGQGLSFDTIIATGENAATLHYVALQSRAKKGQLLLMDVGAREGYYCADVSRTVPVGGKFDEFQRTVYEIVLGANKEVARFAGPGKSIRDLQNHVTEYLANECLAKGIIAKKEDIANYFFHGVSHHIGLDTHDPVGTKEEPLKPGNIISDEPGFYWKEKGIGIRIEDDLLITENGCEVLTQGIIKEIDDIEHFYRR